MILPVGVAVVWAYVCSEACPVFVTIHGHMLSSPIVRPSPGFHAYHTRPYNGNPISRRIKVPNLDFPVTVYELKKTSTFKLGFSDPPLGIPNKTYTHSHSLALFFFCSRNGVHTTTITVPHHMASPTQPSQRSYEPDCLNVGCISNKELT